MHPIPLHARIARPALILYFFYFAKHLFFTSTAGRPASDYAYPGLLAWQATPDTVTLLFLSKRNQNQ
jgi:hypothetical protein